MPQPLMNSLAESAGLLTLLFVPVHQAMIELYKLLGARTRRYYEALAWIIYGPRPPSESGGPPIGVGESWRSGARLVPEQLGPARRRDWAAGAERQLIESFVLRAVGDRPAAEVSDSDIENVVAVVRSTVPPEVRRTIEVLEGLVEAGVSDPEAAADALRQIRAAGAVKEQIESWIAELERVSDARPPVGALLESWRREFIEYWLEGELRARTALANALKSAELRYHRDLNRVSAVLGALEAFSIAMFLRAWEHGIPVFLLTAVVPFGILLIAPRATKGLLDALIGVGARLRG